MFGKEPAAWMGLFGAIGMVAVFYGLLTTQEVELWKAVVLAALPIAQAVLTRQQVMPVETIKEAGIHPEDIKIAADNPNVSRVG